MCAAVSEESSRRNLVLVRYFYKEDTENMRKAWTLLLVLSGILLLVVFREICMENARVAPTNKIVGISLSYQYFPKEDVDHSTINRYSSIFYDRAYLDFRQPYPLLRIPAFRRCRSRKRVFVKFYLRPLEGEESNQTETFITVARPNLINRYCPLMAKNCTWDGYLVDADLPPALLDCPKCLEKVRLTNSPYGKRSMVEFNQFHIAKPPTNTEVPKIKLAVCLQPIYMYADWLQLIQFFEIWKALGAEKIYVYETSKTSNVNAWLNAYEKSGFIERISWSLLPKSEAYDPNNYMYRVGHIGAVHDCILRTSGKVDYVALVDSDEFILPTNPTVPLLQYLNESDAKLNQTLNAGYIFLHSLLHYPEYQVKARNLTIENMSFDHLYDLEQIHHTKGLPKIIAHPHAIDTVSIHGFRLSISGYHYHKVYGARLYHLRRPFAAWKSKAEKKQQHVYTAKFHRIRTVMPILEENFSRFLREYGQELPAEMDTDFELLERIKACLHDWMDFQCKVPHASCAELIKSDPKQWIVNESGEDFKALN